MIAIVWLPTDGLHGTAIVSPPTS